MNGVNVPRDAATARLLGMMQINHPLVLLPVRLETRFVARQADGGGVDFLIRIYPDDIHIDAHERGLTEDEERWGRQFWQNTATAIATEMGMRVSLTGDLARNGFERLLVVGIKATLNAQASGARLTALFDAQHYTHDLALYR